MNALYYVAVGILVGVLTGLTGSSGVLVVVPAFLYGGFSYKQAVGSSLFIDVITTIGVVYSFAVSKLVDYRKALAVGLPAVLGAQTGAIFGRLIPDTFLELAFMAFTSGMAVVSFRRALTSKRSEDPRVSAKGGAARYAFASSMAFVIGNVASLLGASGGIMFLAVMMLAFSMGVKRLIGTATLAMFFTAVSGSLAYLALSLIPLGEALTVGFDVLLRGLRGLEAHC
jgi:uncharacterized membrane protein YfcA